MRLLAASLIYVAVSTLAALLLGMTAAGLNPSISFVSLVTGATGALGVFFFTPPLPIQSSVAVDHADDQLLKYRPIWLCLVGFVFAIFAFRSFCWLLFFSGESVYI